MFLVVVADEVLLRCMTSRLAQVDGASIALPLLPAIAWLGQVKTTLHSSLEASQVNLLLDDTIWFFFPQFLQLRLHLREFSYVQRLTNLPRVQHGPLEVAQLLHRCGVPDEVLVTPEALIADLLDLQLDTVDVPFFSDARIF